MTQPDGRVTFLELVAPRPDGSGGLVRAAIRFRRIPGVVEIEGRSGHGGWPIVARSRSSGQSIAVGLERAIVAIDGAAPLTLTWPPGLPDGIATGAIVDDVPRLAREAAAQRLVAALYGFLPSLGGRPPGLTVIENDDQIRAVVDEMRRDSIRNIIPRTIAARGAFSESALRNYLKLNNKKIDDFLAG